jgi:hypothetical protein
MKHTAESLCSRIPSGAGVRGQRRIIDGRGGIDPDEHVLLNMRRDNGTVRSTYHPMDTL